MSVLEEMFWRTVIGLVGVGIYGIILTVVLEIGSRIRHYRAGRKLWWLDDESRWR